MTELMDVWQGVLIIFIGTIGGLCIIFFGGYIWDSWFAGVDAAGMFDSAAVVGTSWKSTPGIAVAYGNSFYTAGILSIILSWAMGLLTVYRRQRYDQYVRQS